eukprot:jgi/Ulvmu1/4373/UM002_0098.1
MRARCSRSNAYSCTRYLAPLRSQTRRSDLIVRSSSPTAAASWETLQDAVDVYKSAPAQMKQEESTDVLKAFEGLKEAGAAEKWGKAMDACGSRRAVAMGELKLVGVKDPGMIAVVSTRNELAFLVTTVGVTSVLAVAAGALLPGDWGFFSSYLIGGISIGVLAIGSTAPGLLGFAIDKFSQVFPDYRDRVLSHEAAHFLLGYLLGCPVVGYDLTIGAAHIDFAEAKLQKRLFLSKLSGEDVDQLGVISMAGVAAEATNFEDIMGQTADLMDLQRILNRSERKLSDREQQDATRWAVWQAATLLRTYKAEFQALKEAMNSGRTVAECVQAIENA